MVRTPAVTAVTLGLFAIGIATPACTAKSNPVDTSSSETNAACLDGIQDGEETGIDCGGDCLAACGPDGRAIPGDTSNANAVSKDPATNRIKDFTETDIDCGGPDRPKCDVGQGCLVDSDCEVACSESKKCVDAPSCVVHLGGDTCGQGEVGQGSAKHESCCRSLPVPGFTDRMHPGKQVYLDKYEITAGRIRAWIDAIAKQYGGQPNVKRWIQEHRPAVWSSAWDTWLPTDWEGGEVIVPRRLLGDPRPEDEGSTDPPGPGVILPPPTDEPRSLGVNHQFGSEVYVDLHGMGCGVWPNAYGSPTYWYSPEILARDSQLPRADGRGFNGETIPARELLDVKAMNCIPNDMLAAFCAWDGGQLATDEVLDFVTKTPASLGNTSGCGSQYDNHGELGRNVFTNTVQTGGTCPPVIQINATFDAGDALPVPDSPLNTHNYHYPDLGGATHDKAWQISAPGRASSSPAAGGRAVDAIALRPGDEPWMDLAGNLSEAAFDMTGGSFSGLFAIKFRGIGYGSSRSELNVKPVRGETILRVQRPEAKGMYTGGRCMRFR